MSGSASLTLEQGILQHTLGIAAMAFPAQVYVALCAAGLPPSESVGGVEAFGGGYTRVAATFALLASPTNIAANTASVEFPLATAAWGSLGYFEIWTAQTGGSRLYWGGLVDPVSGNATTLNVSAGDIVRFSAGTLAVQAVPVTATASAGVSSFNTRTGAVILSNSDVVGVLPPSANPPLMDGAAAVGTSAAWARGDHVHPTDTAIGHNVGRNLLHNPLFNVVQRGAGSWTAGPVYTLDRWQLTAFTDTASVNRQPLSDPQRSAIGDEAAAVCLYNIFTGSAAAGAYTTVIQKIEGVRRLGGKTVTVSFWAFAASGTPKIGVSIDQFFGNGGSPSAPVFGAGVPITLSGTATRYSVTLSFASTNGKTLGTTGDDWSSVGFWYSSGVTNAFRAGSIGVQAASIALWGVQLEIGSVATPLEKPDPRYDLANCQRFYQTGGILGAGTCTAAVQIYHMATLPVTMRATPVFTTVNSSTGVTSPTVVAVGAWPSGAIAGSGTATATGAYIMNIAWTASADL